MTFWFALSIGLGFLLGFLLGIAIALLAAYAFISYFLDGYYL